MAEDGKSLIERTRGGFTLVEMLIVVGILAILIGLGISTFSSATKKAQKTRGQELVMQVATALDAIYQREGAWPRKFLSGGGTGKLDADTAYELARRGVMSLTYDKDNSSSTKTTGLDRFGVVTPWAADAIKAAGNSATLGTHVGNTSSTVSDHILRYAVDVDGRGIVNACGVRIRNTVAVWCCGQDGKLEEEFSKGLRKGNIYSWTDQQVVK